MPYLTLLLLVSTPLLLEWLFSKLILRLWHRPRWFVLPLVGGFLGWRVPMEILPAIPGADVAFSVFLGVFLGLIVAVFGHFQDTFWRGPDEEEVARTGRRSLYGSAAPRQRP